MLINIHLYHTLLYYTTPHLQSALGAVGGSIGEDELLMDEDGGPGQGGSVGAEKGMRSKAEALAMNRALIGTH